MASALGVADSARATSARRAPRADLPSTRTTLPYRQAVRRARVQARAREIYGRLYRDNECFMNWAEARMAARDAKFLVKLSALMTEKRGQIAEFIKYFYQRVGVVSPAPPEAMAMGFMSLIEGVKLFMRSSPTDMTPDTAEAVLTQFVDSIMQLARLQGGPHGAPQRL
jgi:hypothetical protein